MIDTKQKNIELLKRGAFGNTLRLWDSWRDAVADDSYEGPYVIRSLRAGGPCVYHGMETKKDLSDFFSLDTLFLSDAREDLIKSHYVNERMPDHAVSIQGEFLADESGFHIYYALGAGHMREKLKLDGRAMDGLSALLLLRFYAPTHAHIVEELSASYPGHVVEFTAFEIGVGNLGWPLIIWEVRKY